MDIKLNQPPRVFSVGFDNEIKISDCGRIELEPNEQVTFLTNNGKEYDLTRKDWGFYATPSINGRLRDFGFKTALVKNSIGKYYVMIVEEERLESFTEYIRSENSSVIRWLDEK